MYDLLKDIAQRPEPFSRYTTIELWTRPYLAKQMLKFHLNQETDLASRQFKTIDQTVCWIDSQVNFSKKRICDLGCGPGLYTERFTEKGALVTGVDISKNSIEYATSEASKKNLSISYVQANYLSDDLPSGFDLVTLIYTDLCVLSPAQRSILLARIRGMLNHNGQIIIDVAGMGLLKNKKEFTTIEENLMYGFWSESDYIGIQRSFVYPENNLTLDRYLIIEPNETLEIFNWFQHFTPEGISAELNNSGFSVDMIVGDLTGKSLIDESDFMGVIASIA